VEKRQDMHLLSNKVKEKWIEDYVEQQTPGTRMRVEDTDTAVMEEQDDMNNAEKE
jgi:hypothetical protein